MNNIRKEIGESRVSFGTWLMNPGVAAAEALARLGFGWVIVDLQHGGHGWETAPALMPALELGGAAPLVRVGWNDPSQIMRALDMGAVGVVIPCVATVEEAQAAARAAHYPPLGVRSLGPLRQPYGGGYGPGALEPLCIVMIESRAGLEAADAIAAVEGIDALLLGPGDMALDMGLDPSGEPDERVVAAARAIAAACKRHGKIAAAASFSHGASLAFMAAGMQMLAVGSDAQFLAVGAKLVLGRIAELRAEGADRLSDPEDRP